MRTLLLACWLSLFLAGGAAFAQSEHRTAASTQKSDADIKEIRERVAWWLKTCLGDWDKATHMTRERVENHLRTRRSGARKISGGGPECGRRVRQRPPALSPSDLGTLATNQTTPDVTDGTRPDNPSPNARMLSATPASSCAWQNPSPRCTLKVPSGLVVSVATVSEVIRGIVPLSFAGFSNTPGCVAS